jgi:predicted DsbA family dithiol-disulfide isomerase
MTVTIVVDIVSDIVCPWCAIGYRQLERAAGIVADRMDIGVRWHPFELAPGMPAEGMNIADYMYERYGATPEQGQAGRARIVEAGRSLGIDFRYSTESRMYNTRAGHRLLAWAGKHGGQTPLKLALFDAFFTQQRNVSDPEVLLDAAEAAGLNRAAAAAALEDEAYGRQVDEELAYWRDQNITAVPTFLVQGKYTVPGAQDADTWVRVLDRVVEKEGLAGQETGG